MYRSTFFIPFAFQIFIQISYDPSIRAEKLFSPKDEKSFIYTAESHISHWLLQCPWKISFGGCGIGGAN